jgi:hypothetical protein
MTTQELWQAQALDAPRVSLGYVRHRSREFERRTQIRNGLDYAVCALGAAFIGWYALMINLPIMQAGLALSLAAGLYITVRWHRLAGAARSPGDAAVLDTLRFYRAELERQRDARRNNWRWWLPPSVPGLVLVFASLLLEFSPVPWRLVGFAAGCTIVLTALGVAFYEWSARRIQREIDALDSLATGP